MNQVKHQDLILDAIDQLRRRKARPDAERIYNCLFRRKGVGSSESKIALEKCVEAGVVLRVSYKGNISYRNAAKKYARQRRPLNDAITPIGGSNAGGGGTGAGGGGGGAIDTKPRRKFTNLLTNAFADLVLQEPDYLDLGIPPLNLIKTILSKDSVRYTRKYLWILLQKEVESGGLVRLENGNFLVGKPPSIAAKNQVRDQVLQQAKQKRLQEQRLVYQQRKELMAVRVKDEQENATDSATAVGGGNGRDTHTSNAATAVTHTHTTGSSATVAGTGKHSTNTTRTGGKVGRPPLKRDRLMENMKHSGEDRRGENLRVGGRRKKAKKVFDPSESNMPKRRGRPLGSTKISSKYWKGKTTSSNGTDSRPESSASQNGRTPLPAEGGVCSVCHVQNKKGPAEKMVSCRECSNKAHAHCLNGDVMMLKMYPDNTWQCPHCKTCVICFETSDAGNLVVCSICADAYHNSCHDPRISDKVKPTTKWQCNNCQMPEQLVVDNIQIGFNIDTQKIQNNDETTSHSLDLSRNSSPQHFSSPSSPTLPTLSPQMTHNGHNHTSSESDSKSDIHSLKDDDLDENIDSSIPDASNWTPDEVAQYFSQYFPDEASVFREQEIDGHSLLLMRRMDVLKGLCLKLGPALKIYRHVLKLQYRRDDPKLYWV